MFTGKQSFHKRDTISNSFANFIVCLLLFFFWGGGGEFRSLLLELTTKNRPIRFTSPHHRVSPKSNIF